jgi:hypothetical protein
VVAVISTTMISIITMSGVMAAARLCLSVGGRAAPAQEVARTAVPVRPRALRTASPPVAPKDKEEFGHRLWVLQTHEASDAIVAALGDVSRKIQVVQAASQLAKKADESETPSNWKEDANKTMNAIWDCNGDRVQLAHSFLQPKADGSVQFARLKLEGGKLKGKSPNTWTQDDFKTKVERLDDLAHKLQSMTQDLSRFTIPTTDWLAALFTVPPRLYSSSYLDVLNPHSPGGGTADTPLTLRTGSDTNDTR